MPIKIASSNPFDLPIHSSRGLTELRKRKIILNKLLRLCSCGLIASFVMIIAAAIPVVNTLILKMTWVSYILPALLIFLFIALLLLEYSFSEKKCRELLSGKSNILNTNDINHYPKKGLIIRYLISTFLLWVVMIFTGFSTNYFIAFAFLIAGLLLYITGLCLLSILLKTKRTIKQIIDKSGNHLSLS
jgi:hypothetical protein